MKSVSFFLLLISVVQLLLVRESIAETNLYRNGLRDVTIEVDVRNGGSGVTTIEMDPFLNCHWTGDRDENNMPLLAMPRPCSIGDFNGSDYIECGQLFGTGVESSDGRAVVVGYLGQNGVAFNNTGGIFRSMSFPGSTGPLHLIISTELRDHARYSDYELPISCTMAVGGQGSYLDGIIITSGPRPTWTWVITVRFTGHSLDVTRPTPIIGSPGRRLSSSFFVNSTDSSASVPFTWDIGEPCLNWQPSLSMSNGDSIGVGHGDVGYLTGSVTPITAFFTPTSAVGNFECLGSMIFSVD